MINARTFDRDLSDSVAMLTVDELDCIAEGMFPVQRERGDYAARLSSLAWIIESVDTFTPHEEPEPETEPETHEDDVWAWGNHWARPE